MKLQEAIKKCKKFVKAFKKDDTKSVIGFDVQAIETVLQALESKENKIKDKIKELDNKPIKIYTSNKKYYYETDKYNDIIKQILQELLED